MDIPKDPYHGKGTLFSAIKNIFINQSKKERDYEHANRMKEIYERTMLNRALTKSIYQRRMEEMGYISKRDKRGGE